MWLLQVSIEVDVQSVRKCQEGCPISSHTSISFNNISNILRYVYEKPPYNKKKCGRRLGYLAL